MSIELRFGDDELDRLADRVAERVADRLGPARALDGWLTTRQAADYLGLTANGLHKLTAARSIPFTQDAPGGRCYFKRADLDSWRRGAA